MIKTYEAKNIEEVKEQAMKDFDLPVTDLNFEIIKENKGFLGIGAKIEVEVMVNKDGIEEAKKYIKTILDANGVAGFIEKKIRDDSVEFNIDAGEFNGYLIGKNSRNLIELQTLVSTVCNRYYFGEEKRKVLVDVGGYKKRREKTLEAMAVDWGKQVVKTKLPVTIKDLNSYERKIIHNKLSTWKEITTYSEGEGQERVLIIAIKE